MKNTPSVRKGKSLWGWGIAAVYTTFALSTLGFVAFTMTHRIELVAPDYYQQEIDYQQQIDRLKRSRNPQQQATCMLARDGKFIEVQFPAAIKGVQGRLHLYRPSDSRMDRSIDLAPDAENRQLIPAEKLTNGLWRIKLNWQTQGQSYFQEFTLITGR
jgi:hypothetical protein